MRGGRRRDDGGVAIFGELFERVKDAAIGGSGAFGIGIEDAGELGFRGFADDADVVAAERSGSNDGDASFRHSYTLNRIPRARFPRAGNVNMGMWTPFADSSLKTRFVRAS